MAFIQWKPEIIESMYEKANFENMQCLECKQLPLCGGPCMQTVKEYRTGNVSSFCRQHGTEMDVNAFVKDYYMNFRRNLDLKNKTA